MGMEEGREFVKDKLARSFQKLSAESKKYYQNKFKTVMDVLEPFRWMGSVPKKADSWKEWNAWFMIMKTRKDMFPFG